MENNMNYNYPNNYPNEAVAPQAEKPASFLADKKNLPIIGAAVVAIIVIIAIIAGVAGGGYKKPIKNMAKAYEEQEVDLMYEAYSPMMIDALDEMSGGFFDIEDFIEEEFDADCENLEEECGDDYKVKVEFKDKEKLSKDEIEDWCDDMEEDGAVEYDADDIKKLYRVEVKIYAEGDDGKETIQKGDFYVGKTEDGWGILYVD